MKKGKYVHANAVTTICIPKYIYIHMQLLLTVPEGKNELDDLHTLKLVRSHYRITMYL